MNDAWKEAERLIRLSMEVARHTPETLTTSEALRLLSALAPALLLTSEFSSVSDNRFAVAHVEGSFSDTSDETLRAALNLEPDNPNHTISRTFDPHALMRRVADYHSRAEQGQQESASVRMLLLHLRETRGFILGEDSFSTDPNHPVYILGLTCDGGLVGLSSAVCWA